MDLHPYPARERKRSGHGHVGGCPHGLQRDRVFAIDLDAPPEPESALRRELVEPKYRVVDGQGEQRGSPLAVLEDFKTDILFTQQVVLVTESPHPYGHGDHRSCLAQNAHDSGMAILVQGADDRSRVRQLGGRKLRRQNGQYIGFGHRHLDRTDVEQCVPEGQHPFAVVVGDGADPANRKVAGNEHGGHGLAGVERSRRFSPCRRRTSARPALHGQHSRLSEVTAEEFQNVVVHTRKRKRCFDGRDVGGRWNQSGAVPNLERQLFPGDRRRHDSLGRLHAGRIRGPRQFHFERPALVKLIDFEHQLDGRDAGNSVG